jgi:hypothetical protein
LAVWRRAKTRLRRGDEENTTWLSEQIIRTLPQSISYANSLYYFWASRQYGVVSEEGRQTARRAMHRAAQSVFTTTSALRKALSPLDSWDLRHLVEPVDHQEPSSVLTEPSDWSWIAPTLIAALREDPSLADHVGALIMNTSSHFDREEASPVRRERYILDEVRTMGLFGPLSLDLLSALRDSHSQSEIVVEGISQLTTLSARQTDAAKGDA